VDDRAALSHLEALAEALGVEVRYEGLLGDAASTAGGLCRLKDRYVVIVNAAAGPRGKVETLARALKRFDLSRVYVRPAIRDLLDRLPADEP
jgi:hypothetical protein